MQSRRIHLSHVLISGDFSLPVSVCIDRLAQSGVCVNMWCEVLAVSYERNIVHADGRNGLTQAQSESPSVAGLLLKHGARAAFNVPLNTL